MKIRPCLLYTSSALVDPLSNFLVDTIHIPVATARGASMAVVVILITYFSIVIGELVPKRIGQMGADAVSYTHLDVYKRQGYERGRQYSAG